MFIALSVNVVSANFKQKYLVPGIGQMRKREKQRCHSWIYWLMKKSVLRTVKVLHPSVVVSVSLKIFSMVACE